MRRMTQEFRDSHQVAKPEVPSTSLKVCATVKDLTISYNGKNAVNSLSTTFYENEIVAIMGRNGAGKSSLLRALAGVSDNAAGEVIVNGINSQKLHSKQRRENIGYIPQEPSDLLYGQSVGEECKQADNDNEVASGTTFTLLSQLVPGISAQTHPRDLSEGQRLGLALSVVLSANPHLLILDEPTRGLDYQAKRVLTKMLIDFARVFNRSVIIATHDVELVAELATRTIFIADGDIVADGATIDVLLSSPAFAPQVSKIMSPQPWLTVADVVRAIEADS
jgi:energy-coupling factor transport system ATP-binding protein